MSIEPVGLDLKLSHALEAAPNQSEVGFANGGNSVLSSQEQLELIDRDLTKFDQIEGGVSMDVPYLSIDLSRVSVGSKIAGLVQFLKSSLFPVAQVLCLQWKHV